MKQFWSKSLACLLCLALLVGMLPVVALAEDNPPANGGVSLADAATDTPIEIDSADEMAKIGDDGYPLNGSYVLTDDINLEGSANNAWKSIGYGGKSFTGTFDGAGHTISGLYLNSNSIGGADRGAGLFTSVGKGGMVRNLTVKAEIAPPRLKRSSIGGVVGVNNGGTISSCTGSVVVNGDAGFHVGGVVGANSGGTISRCTGSVVVNGNADFSVGGIVGSNESGTIENCCNTGSIDVTGSSTDSANGISGIVGTNNGTVENCENTGKVTVGGKGVIGGIVGRANGSSKVSNCCNSGDISANMDGSITGGIVGDNYGAISRCNNTGAVSADGATGGVAGQNVCSQSGPNSIVENCYNTGAVSGSGDVGGVVGHNNNSEKYVSKIKNCFSTGAVSSGNSSNVGSVVGQIATGDVSDCYYLGQEGLPGIGSGTATNVVSKTAEQYASGEVAWLLQSGQAEQNGQVWGQQNLGDADSLPELTSEENYSVIQVTFKVSEEDTQPYTVYTTPGSTVTFPADPEAPAGQAFAGWYSGDTKCESGATFTEDTTLTAKFETPYTVTVNGSYAAGTGAGSYFAGASVTVSAGARPGYRFAGWRSEEHTSELQSP